MVDPGNYFLLEMLVFTAESEADFLITPGKRSVSGEGIGSGEEGLRTFCACGHRKPFAQVSSRSSETRRLCWSERDLFSPSPGTFCSSGIRGTVEKHGRSETGSGACEAGVKKESLVHL